MINCREQLTHKIESEHKETEQQWRKVPPDIGFKTDIPKLHQLLCMPGTKFNKFYILGHIFFTMNLTGINR